MAQLASLPTIPELTNFPNFFRLTPPSIGQVLSMRDTILYYIGIQSGWNTVAVLSTTDGFGVSMASSFIENATPEITIASYRQYIADPSLYDNLLKEMDEIKNSGARVIVSFTFDEWEITAGAANQTGIIGENYVWFVPNSIVSLRFDTEELRQLSRGIIGTIQGFIENEQSRAFEARWLSLDPAEIPVAGPGNPPLDYTRLYYDMVITAAKAIELLQSEGNFHLHSRISGEIWADALHRVEFEGISEYIKFDANGDLQAAYNVRFYDPETASWELSATWEAASGYSHLSDVVWSDNTTEVPDLDIRAPFDYYSCHDKKFRTDETGKTISLHTPDGSDVDDIDSEYYCDHFIDCDNMSDEGHGCHSNVIVLFIVFGTLTGIFMLLALIFAALVVVFGIILEYRRLRAASPPFLVLILLSVFIGFSSNFAWFGKPHPVACAFQPWLLGLPALSMIVALGAKNFRLWRIFRFPMDKVKISDMELFGLWFVLMLPAVIIVTVWTIVSTPTAAVEEHDGKDHFVCTTGGFTGTPGGIIFFSIFVFYGAIVLAFGIFITIVSRKVPSRFNESKLVAISIYNLSLLSVVVIPVYMVVVEYNPFLAWIIRACAITYAFGATMLLQFLPIFVGIFVLDKFKNDKSFKSNLKGHTNRTSSSSKSINK